MTDQTPIDTDNAVPFPTTTKPTKPIPYWWPETRAAIVAWMMTSSFALVVLCWWRPPPADNQIVVMLLSVYVSTGFVTALQWWMGSSKSSSDKDAVQATSTKALADAVSKQ